MAKNIDLLLEISVMERLRLLRYGVLSKKYKKVSRLDVFFEFLIKNSAVMVITTVSALGILATNNLGELRYIFVGVFTFGAIVTFETVKKDEIIKRKTYNPHLIIGTILQEFKLSSTLSFNQDNLQEIKFHLDFRQYFESLIHRGYITPKEYRVMSDIKIWVDMVSEDYKIRNISKESFGKNGFQNRMVTNLFLFHKESIEHVMTLDCRNKKSTLFYFFNNKR